VTWTAPGAWLFANSTGLTVSNQAIGNLLLVGVTNTSNNTVWCTGLSGGGATWVLVGTKFAGTAIADYFTLFAGTVTATGAGTVTPSWSGTTPAGYHLDGHEFSSSVGAWSLDVQGTVDAVTGSWASLTPCSNGELYFGFEDNLGSAGAGSTSGYVYSVNASSAGRAYNLSCPSGVATFPTWTDSTDTRSGIMVLMREVTPAPAALAPLYKPLPPGWFPGADQVTTSPGAVPFGQVPAPADPSQVILPPNFPEATGFLPPALPPGWFPGADKATTEPGGIPFYAQPQPAVSPPPQPPAPDNNGEVQWLPWPPNYFPGSQAVTVDPGGVPFYSQPQPLLAPPPPLAPPCISGLAGKPGPGWFTDQYGNPKLWVCAQPWGLVTNAGRYAGTTGGTWQQDIDRFIATRAAQGCTAILVYPIQNTDNGGVFDNGNTWDNVPPFNTGQDPASGLNNTYWTRIDYMLTSAQNAGLAQVVNIDPVYNTAVGRCFNGWTLTQWQQWAAALGARYGGRPGLHWCFGEDGVPGGFDSQYDAFLTGLASAGDTHYLSAMWAGEYTSRYETDNNANAAWGTAHSAFNFVYTYNCGYFCIEYAYNEISHGASVLLPVVWGNGWYYAGSGLVYSSAADRPWRQEIWWCLASGARGFCAESHERLWSSSAPGSAATQWSFVNALPNIVSTYSSWTQWYNLLPDLSSALVTAGRGTRVGGLVAGGSGTPYEPAFTNSYVAASKTPDGTLAVCYLPNSTTITVNTALLAGGWTASWIDPISGAASSAGAGPTFNSTAKGTNSQGDPDWALVFQAPPVRGATRARQMPSADSATSGMATFT